MFETLFSRPSVLARHRTGPLSEERERFIERCAMQGYSRSMLGKIAWVLLAIAPQLSPDGGPVTGRDIELAVAHRTRFRRQPKPATDSASSRQLFVHFATEWVRSLGRLAPAPPASRPFASQIEDFSRYLGDERGLSPVTIATQRERLGWFLDGLEPPRDSLRALSIADVDAFVAAKASQGWRRSSLATLVSSLRSFLRYAEGQGWCAPGLAAAIDSPRLYTREGLPQGPGWDDVQRLLASTADERPAAIRDHAILLLLALYGLRRGEVAALRVDDLDWLGEQIAVLRPKQRRVQRYPLLPAVGEAILRYVREARPRAAHRALFLTLAAPVRPLSAESISAIAHARLRAIGVRVSPRGAHCLRHACARHLLASGFTLKQIGDHLGHRNANATLSYAKVDLAGLRQVAEIDLGRLL